METTFFLNAKSEFIKSKRTAASWLTVVGAAFIPAINFVICVVRPEVFLPQFRANPWGTFIDHNWRASTVFLFPMYIILVTSLVVQIEYRSNTWKQVYASPRCYADIFFTKFIVIQGLILCCLVLFNASIVCSGLATNLLDSRYGFLINSIPWNMMLVLVGKMYVSVLAISAIQYGLSLQFRNFIAPLGIGLALVITGLIIKDWEKLFYYPYMYPAIMYFPNFKADFVHKTEIYSGVWFILALLLGFGAVNFSKEKG